MKETISIIVPIYNVESYLERCLQSLVGQTYSDIEIILVDDGSTDSCPQICDKWAENDERIKVIHKENGGLSDARNAGIAVATGDYIAFVDSDDWVELDYYEVLIQKLIENDADIIECGVYLVNEMGELLTQRSAKNEILVLNRVEALQKLVMEDGVYQTVWNKLYKRGVIQNILFEVGKYHEDEFWTYQVLDRMERMVIISSPKYYYMQRSSSIMGERYSIKRLDGLEARMERMQFLQKYDKLSTLTKQQLWYSLLFHFQNAIYYLTGAEKDIAVNRIKKMMKEAPLTSKDKEELSMKYKCWFGLFSRIPYITARIRNILKIGLN